MQDIIYNIFSLFITDKDYAYMSISRSNVKMSFRDFQNDIQDIFVSIVFSDVFLISYYFFAVIIQGVPNKTDDIWWYWIHLLLEFKQPSMTISAPECPWETATVER